MAAFLPAVVNFFIATFTAAGIAGVTAVSLATFTTNLLVVSALSLASRALSGRPKGPGRAPIELQANWSTEPGPMIFGQRRVAGVVQFVDTSGPENKTLHYVIAYARHQCEEISDVWFDNERIAAADINATTGEVTGGKYAGKAYIWKHLGRSDATNDTALTSAISTWDADHDGRGITYLHIRLTLDPDVYPNGAPQNFFALIKGQRVYDPRKDGTNGGSGSHRVADPTTWEWSNNAALCQASYLIGGSLVYNTTGYTGHLGFGADSSLVDWPSVITAANICDESLSGGSAPPSGAQVRYTCDGVLSSGNMLSDNMDQLLTASAGQITFAGGKYHLYAADYETPSITLTADDLIGDIEFATGTPTADRYNGVRGEYFSAVTWQQAEFRARTDSSYVTRDNGRELWRDIELPMTTDEYRAQRLAELALNQSENQQVLKFPCGLNGYKVGLWETVKVTISELGLAEAVFRCIGWELESEGKVTLELRQESSGAYADPATGDYLAPSSVTGSTNTEDVLAAPTNFTATSAASAIVFQWSLPSPFVPGSIFELYEYTSATSFGDATKIATTTTNNYTLPRTDTTQRYYWVRAKLGNAVSAYTPSTVGLPGKAASLAAALGASVDVGTVSHDFSGSTSATSGSVTVTATGGTGPYTYAWTHVSGDASVTVTSASAATTTFGVTGLSNQQSASAIKRCTVTDSLSATTTVDVSVTFARDDGVDVVTAPNVTVFTTKISPTNAGASFRIAANGKWYTGNTVGATVERGDWVLPNGNANLYSVRVTRTGGSATSFNTGTDGSWVALTSDRTWSLLETTDGNATKNIIFTVELALTASTGTVISTTTGNSLTCAVEI